MHCDSLLKPAKGFCHERVSRDGGRHADLVDREAQRHETKRFMTNIFCWFQRAIAVVPLQRLYAEKNSRKNRRGDGDERGDGTTSAVLTATLDERRPASNEYLKYATRPVADARAPRCLVAWAKGQPTAQWQGLCLLVLERACKCARIHAE